jgi:hypothetical protein
MYINVKNLALKVLGMNIVILMFNVVPRSNLVSYEKVSSMQISELYSLDYTLETCFSLAHSHYSIIHLTDICIIYNASLPRSRGRIQYNL